MTRASTLPACLLVASFVAVALAGCAVPSAPSNVEGRHLLVLAAPSVWNDYYADDFDALLDYQVGFVHAALGRDNVVLVADADTLPYLEGRVPDDVLLEGRLDDVWIRDFGAPVPHPPTKFVFAPQYLDAGLSRDIDDAFHDLLADVGVALPESPLVLDGGNVVDNGAGWIVTTTRVLDDNPGWTRAEVETELERALGAEAVAFLPEVEGDTTGHSDGMVMWATPDHVLVAEHEEPLHSEVRAGLGRAFPGVRVTDLPTDYSLSVWKDFPTACGLYVNSVQAPGRVYVPTFGLDADAEALEAVRAATDREVVPVDASGVCHMGGSVRCLAWQVEGEAADRIVRAARRG